jgi:glucosamine--fructose-6-phosphate aminotransferase (isomerizing)
MCGIVGYVGAEDRAQDVILGGLRRLEYRGYDSAGAAVLEDGKIRVVRELGKLMNLEATLRDVPLRGNIGIGHTRWATHGQPHTRTASAASPSSTTASSRTTARSGKSCAGAAASSSRTRTRKSSRT